MAYVNGDYVNGDYVNGDYVNGVDDCVCSTTEGKTEFGHICDHRITHANAQTHNTPYELQSGAYT